MNKNSRGDWKSNVGQPYYINISQLSLLAARLNYSFKDLNKVGHINKLSDLGIELGAFILSFKKLVNSINPITQSFNMLKFEEIKQDSIIEFSERFNSKNSRYLREGTYNLGNEPHLWKKYGEYKVIMNLNPKWVTTDTAYSSLSRNAEFAGLCLVKQVDMEQKTIYATPLFIGIPKNLDFFANSQTPYTW